jgi:hypothetical protein
MRRRSTLAILVLAVVGLALVLAGCSQPISPLDASSAAGLAAVSRTGDDLLTGMMNPSDSFTPASLGAAALSAAGLSVQPLSLCTNETFTKTGWGTDTDGDGIPDHATTAYACNTPNVTLKGTLTVTDRSGMYTGYTASITGFELQLVSGGQTYTLTGKSTFDLSGTPSTSYGADFTFDLHADLPNASGSLSLTGHPGYTPDSATDPFTAGTFTLHGEASYDDTNGHHYRLTRTGTGLHFAKANTGCVTLFDGGNVTYQDSKGNDLDIGFTCPSVTATFNQQPLP